MMNPWLAIFLIVYMTIAGISFGVSTHFAYTWKDGVKSGILSLLWPAVVVVNALSS